VGTKTRNRGNSILKIHSKIEKFAQLSTAKDNQRSPGAKFIEKIALFGFFA